MYEMNMLKERMKEYDKRYKAACQLKTEFGETITPGTAAVYRSDNKNKLNLCRLIYELATANPKAFINLSADAHEAFAKIIEPTERHRRLKR